MAIEPSEVNLSLLNQKKKIQLEVTMMVEIEIDENDDIVKDYENTSELLNDIISYQFSSVLPVIASGAVKVEFNGFEYEIL